MEPPRIGQAIGVVDNDYRDFVDSVQYRFAQAVGMPPSILREGRNIYEPAAAQIVSCLHRCGPQSDRYLIDSMALNAAFVRVVILALSASGRIERHGADCWRLVRSSEPPTGNPGT